MSKIKCSRIHATPKCLVCGKLAEIFLCTKDFNKDKQKDLKELKRMLKEVPEMHSQLLEVYQSSLPHHENQVMEPLVG